MNKKTKNNIYNKHISLILREARLKKGYKIHHIVESLNINEEFLMAIESGQLGKLPIQTYTLGFVRSYAQFLDLDPFLTLDSFKKDYNIHTREDLEVPSGEELRIVSMADKLNNPFSAVYDSQKVLILGLILVVLFLFYRIFTSYPRTHSEINPSFQERVY
ncbi:helix-turn-helix domain-containing protein [Alphaproteobacteria bacterium]|nr:helix-turn-helix domain-containing protein [Alphaproteobacteria bacterium]